MGVPPYFLNECFLIMKKNTKEIILDCTIRNAGFIILYGIALILLVASFILPPMGVIDSSVLKAVAEIFAFAGLLIVLRAIDRNMGIEFHKGDMSLEISDSDDENSPENPR